MSAKPEHLSFETLNDLVDERLDPATTDGVEQHLRHCAECAAEHARLLSLLTSTADLPLSVLPPDDMWSDLKSVLDKRKDLVLPLAGAGQSVAPPQVSRRNPWRFKAGLAAAAVLLIALSSGITALVLRSGSVQTAVIQPKPTDAPDSGPGAQRVLLTTFRSTEGEYARTIEELRTAFEAQRSTLSPQTVKTVDRSLAVVDSAIAEARSALLADPNNRTLVDLLSASYQRKLDLLRRTSELSSRT